MEYQTLENLTNYREAVLTGVGLGSFILGVGIGYFSKRKSLNQEIKLAEIEKDRLSITGKIKQTELEADKLRYENADKEHQRKLELMDRERGYELQDKDTAYKRKLELAEKLDGLKPVLESYIRGLKSPASDDEDTIKKRQSFRDELLNECLEYFRGGDGIANQIIVEGEEVINENAIKIIENVVNAKYPLKGNQSPIPPELKKLIDLIL